DIGAIAWLEEALKDFQGAVLFILMTTWKRGKQLLAERIDEGGLPLPIFISSIRVQPPHRVQGTAGV
ncbi:potassium uptake protein, partial [Pseudomonas savastanoi pv. glycinea str. race 4]